MSPTHQPNIKNRESPGRLPVTGVDTPEPKRTHKSHTHKLTLVGLLVVHNNQDAAVVLRPGAEELPARRADLQGLRKARGGHEEAKIPVCRSGLQLSQRHHEQAYPKRGECSVLRAPPSHPQLCVGRTTSRSIDRPSYSLHSARQLGLISSSLYQLHPTSFSPISAPPPISSTPCRAHSRSHDPLLK